MFNLILGSLFILIISLAGFRMKALSRSGAIAAYLVGFFIYLGFSWAGLMILGAFFASSSFWSKVKHKEKAHIEQKLSKTSERDWTQVLANGGVAALIASISIYNESTLLVILFSISLAAANSDTWASEIGPLNRNNPISIRTWRKVEKGTSGAISLLGTLASILGAFFIAVITSIFFNEITLFHLLLITIFGLLGSIIDTIIGSTVQAKYKCLVCNQLMEKSYHCHKPTKLVMGFSIFNNEMVNLLSILLSCLLFLLFFY